jgi:hypothetical protein
MGAFPAYRPGTGLSACIFFACGKKGYRSYPLRGRTPAEFALSKPLRGFDFAEFHFVKLREKVPLKWSFRYSL